jgi:hypothetical protein
MTPDCHDLGQHGPGDLGGPLRPDIEPGGPVEGGQVVLVGFDAPLRQVVQEPVQALARPKHAYVRHPPAERRFEVGEVAEVVVRHDHHDVGRSKIDCQRQFRWAHVDELGCSRKALGRKEGTAVVDQDGLETEFGTVADERSGVVARPANYETAGSAQHLDHHPLTVHLGNPVPSLLQGGTG